MCVCLYVWVYVCMYVHNLTPRPAAEVSVRKDGEIGKSMRGAVFSLCVSTCLSSGCPPQNQTWDSTRGQSTSRRVLRGTTEGCKASGGGVLMAAHLQVFVGAFAKSILSVVVRMLWCIESFSGCIHCCLHFWWCLQVSNFEEKKSDLENLRSEEVGFVAKMGWFWALVLRANALAGPLVMLLYPLYASIKAIESPFKEDDQLWLTYWVLYSFVTLLELVAAPVIAWIPLWSTIKLAVAAWLVLPQFRGGIIVYERYVRPYFYSAVQNADAKLTDSQRKFLSSISPEARNSVAQFIDDNGSDAFDKIMAAATTQSRKNRGSS